MKALLKFLCQNQQDCLSMVIFIGINNRVQIADRKKVQIRLSLEESKYDSREQTNYARLTRTIKPLVCLQWSMVHFAGSYMHMCLHTYCYICVQSNITNILPHTIRTSTPNNWMNSRIEIRLKPKTAPQKPRHDFFSYPVVHQHTYSYKICIDFLLCKVSKITSQISVK